jgi:hypothetical protein
MAGALSLLGVSGAPVARMHLPYIDTFLHRICAGTKLTAIFGDPEIYAVRLTIAVSYLGAKKACVLEVTGSGKLGRAIS